MEAIGHDLGLGQAQLDDLTKGLAHIHRRHLDLPGVLQRFEPLLESLAVSSSKARQDSTPRQVTDDRLVALSLANRVLVDSQPLGSTAPWQDPVDQALGPVLKALSNEALAEPQLLGKTLDRLVWRLLSEVFSQTLCRSSGASLGSSTEGLVGLGKDQGTPASRLAEEPAPEAAKASSDQVQDDSLASQGQVPTLLDATVVELACATTTPRTSGAAADVSDPNQHLSVWSPALIDDLQTRQVQRQPDNISRRHSVLPSSIVGSVTPMLMVGRVLPSPYLFTTKDDDP